MSQKYEKLGTLSQELFQFDQNTGVFSLDERFRADGSTEPGLRMEGITWPHGGSGGAVPHGAVFSRE